MVLVHDATEAFRVGEFGGILIRTLAEASLDDVFIVEGEVLSEIEAFFQVAFCAFFEVLRAEALVTAVEATGGFGGLVM